MTDNKHHKVNIKVKANIPTKVKQEDMVSHLEGKTNQEAKVVTMAMTVTSIKGADPNLDTDMIQDQHPGKDQTAKATLIRKLATDVARLATNPMSAGSERKTV